MDKCKELWKKLKENHNRPLSKSFFKIKTIQHKILMDLNFSRYLNLEVAFFLVMVVVLESGDTFQFRNFLYI